MVVSSLTVDDFLDLYLLSYVAQYVPLMISTRATISPGSIIFCSSLQRATFLEIATSPDLYFNVNKWDHAWDWAEPGINHGKITEESWIRYFTIVATQLFVFLTICYPEVFIHGKKKASPWCSKPTASTVENSG
jgi:hypothetical protein